MDDFSTWLVTEIERRGWNKSELARRAGVSDSTVSMVIGRQRNAGLDFCIGVGNALGILPEHVLRRAGLLPALPSEVEEEQEIVNLLRLLSAQVRGVILTTLRCLVAAGRSLPQIANGEVLYEAHRPRTFAERQAYRLGQELRQLSPEDQDKVFTFMKWLRGDRGVKEGGVVPVDSDS